MNILAQRISYSPPVTAHGPFHHVDPRCACVVLHHMYPSMKSLLYPSHHATHQVVHGKSILRFLFPSTRHPTYETMLTSRHKFGSSCGFFLAMPDIVLAHSGAIVHRAFVRKGGGGVGCSVWGENIREHTLRNQTLLSENTTKCNG